MLANPVTKITDFRNYVSIIEDLVENEGMESFRGDLEQGLVMLGMVLTIDNKADQAKPYLEKAIKLNIDQKFTKYADLLLEAQTRPDASQLPKMLMGIFENRPEMSPRQ